MKNDILKFFKQINITKNNELYNSKLKPSDYFSGKETYSFYLASIWSYPYALSDVTSPLIRLDEEDMQYFINKYKPLLQEELTNKLNNIKKEYENF